jgi:hypothetical protein
LLRFAKEGRNYDDERSKDDGSTDGMPDAVIDLRYVEVSTREYQSPQCEKRSDGAAGRQISGETPIYGALPPVYECTK